jgi:hypothetical protein
MAPAQYAKALAAGAVGLLGTLGASMADGDVTAAELIVSVGAALVAVATVFQVPNAPLATPPAGDVGGEVG